jgi:hypothetical protein
VPASTLEERVFDAVDALEAGLRTVHHVDDFPTPALIESSTSAAGTAGASLPGGDHEFQWRR